MEKIKKKRNLQIDTIRFLLILAVVFYHYTKRFTEQYGYATIDFPGLDQLGAVAVGGFFVLSGYFLWQKKEKNISLIDFFVKRLIRLFPAYILAITIIFISTHLFGLPGKEVSFTAFLWNIPFLNGIIGQPYVDGAHWFLTYIIIFTVIVGILTKLKIPVKVYLPIWLILQITVKIVLLSFGKSVWLERGYKLIGGDYATYAIIGLALADFVKGNVWAQMKRGAKMSVLGLTVLGALASISAIWSIYFTIATVIVIGIIILALYEKLPILERIRILPKFGEGSYVLYLIHQLLGFQIILGLIKLTGRGDLALVYGLGTTVVMICAAQAIHIWYEIPIQKHCLAAYSRLKKKDKS